jgi:serine O-acetyltransferase
MRIWDCFSIDFIHIKNEKPGLFRIIKWMILKQGYWVVVLYRISCLIKSKVLLVKLGRSLNRFIISRIAYRFGVVFNLVREIGQGLYLPHPYNIIIGFGARIGENVTIYNGVSLGERTHIDLDDNKDQLKRYPTIEDNVVIYAGAKIVGPVIIGHNSIVGANAVVLDSFPPNSVLAGIPARKVADLADGDALG